MLMPSAPDSTAQLPEQPKQLQSIGPSPHWFGTHCVKMAPDEIVRQICPFAQVICESEPVHRTVSAQGVFSTDHVPFWQRATVWPALSHAS